MIPNLTTDTVVSGSLGGNKKQMGIDQNSVAHIMSVLTDLYSDPELAVIREYSTNALDAHREAGTQRPIEVTTPSTFSNIFSVQDFGVGLTANEIQDVYAMYGASTKRGSNDVVGMLGLGSKSGLTYTNQFTVVAVKNGVKTSVAIYRTEDGTGTSEVVDTVATNEPNGVKIVIPVKDRNNFAEKCERFFKWWAKGTVLVNGQEPKSALDNLTEIEPGLYAQKGANYYDTSASYIVMGNVPYPISNFHDKFLDGQANYAMRRFSMVAYVPIGSVNFTPSREALHYTTLTNNTIKDAARRWLTGLERAAKDEILNAPDATTAWKLWDGWRSTFKFSNLTYNGMQFVDAVTHSHIEYDINAYRNAVASSSNYPLRLLSTSIFVQGFTNSTVTATNKKKIKQYLRDNSISGRHVVLSATRPMNPWLKNVTVYDWNDIKAVVLPNTGNGGSRGGSKKQVHYDYETNVNGKVEEEYQTPLPAKPGKVLYYSPREKNIRPDYILTGLPERATIVCIAANRWDKFKRDFPGAEHVVSYAYRRMNELNVVSDEYRKFVGIDGTTKEILKSVDTTLLDDPDVVAMANFVQTYKVNDNDRTRASNVASGISRYLPPVDPIEYNLGMKYPLLVGVHRYNVAREMEHIILYMNAAYNSKESN